MADIALTIKANFQAAEKAFQAAGISAEDLQKNIERMKKSFTPEHIEKFQKKMALNAAAITATRGPVAGLTAQTNGLRKEIERLINAGINPEDESLKRLRTEYARLTAEKARATKATGSFGGTIGKLLGPLRSLMPMLSVVAAFRLGNDAIEAWRKQEAAIANVNAGLAATGNRIGMTSQELQRMAEDAQKAGIFGDEDILQNATAQLLTFSRVGKDSFNRVQKAALDVTAKLYGVNATGENLRGTSIMLGKALEDPRRGLSALRRVGISFTDSEDARIKKMIEANNISGAHVEILKSIERQYGGTNEALAKTAAGMEIVARNRLGDSLEKIGKIIDPIRSGLIKLVADVVGKFADWVSEGDNLRDALRAVAAVALVVGAGIAGYVVATKGALMVTKLWTIAQTALNVVLNANPIGLIVAGVAALAAGVYLLIKYWDQVKFHVTDFATTAKIKLMQLEIVVRENLIKAVKEMLMIFGRIPSMRYLFKPIDDISNRATASINATIEVEKKRQSEQRAAYAEWLARNKKEKQSIEDIKGAHQSLGDFMRAEGKREKKDAEALLQEKISRWNTYIGHVTNIVGSVANLVNNLYRRQIQNIDLRMQRELEAAGVAEKTTRQQAQIEYDAAVKTGNAVVIEEKKRALTKATIEEKYQEKRRALEYKSAMTAWKLQIAMAKGQAAMAILNAYSAGVKFGPIVATAYAALATIASGIQVAAVYASKPVAPKAETGISYTVPEVRATRGDRAAVMAQGGETVTVTPRGENAGGNMVVNIQIEDATLIRVIQRYIDTGRVNISNRNLGRGVFA